MKAQNKVIAPNAHVNAWLDHRIRSGILPLETACQLFTDNACSISEASWLLNTEPFARSKVAWMGLSRDVDFDKKYEHGFIVVRNQSGKPIMALHTMPNDRSENPLPNAMGDRNCKIDVFPVTIDASNALCRKRGHDERIDNKRLPLSHVSERAGLLRSYCAHVHAADIPYTVPVMPVRAELTAALLDGTTLFDFRPAVRPLAAGMRRVTLKLMNSLSDAGLAWWLNPATRYRLGADGFNSNSGAADIMTLLGHAHSWQRIKAPFCNNSVLETMPALTSELQRVNALPPEQLSAIASLPAVRPRRRKWMAVFSWRPARPAGTGPAAALMPA